MEHKVITIAAPVHSYDVDYLLASTRVRGWTLVSVSQSYPTEPMFLFWRKD